MKIKLKTFCASLILILIISDFSAQITPIQIVETNTNSFPFTVRVVSSIPDLQFHDIIKIDGEDEGNTQTLRFQFVGDGINNAMSGFDTTVNLMTDNSIFDLCIYVDWIHSPLFGYPPNDIVWDSVCLANEVLNYYNAGLKSKVPIIYPNPAEDYFFVVYDENAAVNQDRKVNIYNLSGILVQSIDFAPNNLSLEISTKTWDHGFYLVEVIENGVSISTKRVLVR